MTVASRVEVYQPSNQYTSYPVTATSSVDGDQLSVMPAGVTGPAVSPAGAAGGTRSGPVSVIGVTTVTASEGGERCPAPSRAVTRNVYCVPGRMLAVTVAVVTSPTGADQNTSLKACA